MKKEIVPKKKSTLKYEKPLMTEKKVLQSFYNVDPSDLLGSGLLAATTCGPCGAQGCTPYL